MRTWTDTVFALTETDDPMVTRHDDSVSLHLPGYRADGRGFSLRFLPAHLVQLRALCAALEQMAAPEPDPAWAAEDASQDQVAEKYYEDHLNDDVDVTTVEHDLF